MLELVFISLLAVAGYLLANMWLDGKSHCCREVSYYF